MSHVLRVGVADQIAYFRAFNADGSAKTDFTSATAGAALSVFRVGLAEVSIASLSNKATDSTTHADGAIRNVGGNLYTVDLPDAATATQCPSIGVRGSFTGGVIEPIPHPLVGYNPASVAVGAPTVAQLDAAVNTINNYTLTNVVAVDTYQKALDAKNAIDALGLRVPAALVGGKMSSYLDPADRTGFSLAADQAVNVTKVGGTAVSGPSDLKADVSSLATTSQLNARTLAAADYFDPATDAVSLQPDQGVNIVKVAGAVASADPTGVYFPYAIGNSYLSPVNVGQVLMDYGAAKTSDVTAIPAAVWSHATRTLSAFGFSVTVGTNNDKTGYSLSQAFPSNFASLGINASGHISRVTLVDTTTVNSDMRGTDAALLAASYAAPPSAVAIADEVRTELATELARIDVAISSVSGGGGGGTDWTPDERTAIRSVLGIPASGTAPVTPTAGALHGLATAIDAVPTTAEFDARTLPAAQYATAAGVTDLQSRLPATLVGGRIDAHVGSGSVGATPAEIWTHADRTLTSASAEVEVDTAALAAAIADELTSAGLYRLTVSVVDEGADAVPGVIVQILGVAGTTRTTGTAGESLIDLDPGPYTLRVTVPAGYEPVADRTIEIIDQDVAEVIELVSTVTLPSEAAPYCLTRFAVQDQFTETAEGTLIDVEFVRFLPGATRTAVVISPSGPLVTGAEGYVDAKLNRMAEYSAKYAVPGKMPKSLRFTTPDAGSYLVVEP